MGRFAVITMTDKAADRVREIVATRDNAHGIRLGIRKGGCAGMEYTVDLVTEPINEVEADAVVTALIALTECIGPQLAAVDRLFTRELRSDLPCVNVLIRHVARFRGKMLRPSLLLLWGKACCGESVELKPADLKALAEARASA